jgi:4-amino-4-deoxy-L-arabinose transferase-like glycosyltransferase
MIQQKHSFSENIASIPSRYHKQLFILILFIGCLVRLFAISTVPAGLNQDEAYAGYEAYSLLNYGMDSHGYANPVYFVSWGSGMNVLYSYLTIPSLILTGNHLTAFAIRLPQALFSCLSLIVFYLLLKQLFHDSKKSLLGLFIFAIMPWHIMLSHWGLESNIAPAFLLFGLFFWIKAMDNSKFFLLSALFYGLSLYAYAPLWMAVPFILVLQFIYSLFMHKLNWDRFFVLAVLLLFILALPLFLFLLINNGIIPEIHNGLFSIPKLLEYRGGELSLQNIKIAVLQFCTLLITQNDHLIWNSTPYFGMYYKFSILFIVIGLISIAKTTFSNAKEKTYNPKAFILINVLVSIMFALLINNINVNKINMIHIPLIICCIQGIISTCDFFKFSLYKYVILLYLLSFIGFSGYYFNNYHKDIAEPFQYQANEAVQSAMNKTEGTICINKDVFYSNILFATQIPVTRYLDTVHYDPNFPTDATPLSFDRYVFGYDTTHLDKNWVYVIKSEDSATFIENGFSLEAYSGYAVAYNKN